MRAKITEHQQTNKTKSQTSKIMFIVHGFHMTTSGIYFYKLIINIEKIFFLRFYILSVHSSIKVETELYIFLTILIKHKNDNTNFQLRYNVTSLG